jgi:hypothetical protein
MKHINDIVVELHKAANSKKWVADPPMKEATDYLNSTKWGYSLVHDAFLIAGNSVIEEAGQYGRKHGLSVEKALTIDFILERVANIMAYMKLTNGLLEKAELKGVVFFVERDKKTDTMKREGIR